MSDTKPDHGAEPIIIIKRIKKVHAGHHGGSWKIAYADFVTAMMAFFLLMWLLSLLNKYQLEGIARYFKQPLNKSVAQSDKIVNQDKQLSKSSSVPNQDQKAFSTGNSKNKKLSAEQAKINEIKKEFEEAVAKDPAMAQYKNLLNFVVVSDGLKIEINELKDKPMFSSGKTDFEAYAKEILAWLSTKLNGYPNNVQIIGHTDSNPYKESFSYSNWELSTDRANATRRALVGAGMDGKRVVRIIGEADVDSADTSNERADKNRRIEIVILTDEAARKVRTE